MIPMPFTFSTQVIEEQIHKEFRAAFDETGSSHRKEKDAATARLNRAVRRLYDYVGYGKVPQELHFKGPACS
jgi:hypothetical protein